MTVPYITNIQKYSIHDGDGARTTVFFKGCPLRCKWCHNPETQKYPPELSCDTERCTGCGRCAGVCKNDAIEIRAGKAVTDRSRCRLCEACTDVCLLNLRERIGKQYTVKELMKILKQDRIFYENSGGGVTLSGGEVFAQDAEYIGELLKAIRFEGFSVYADTCGEVPFERLAQALPYVDTFLYDVKLMDSALHREWTGAGNERILDNLVRLANSGARIYLRIPMTEGLSATPENIGATIAFMKENDIRPARINLLPYHNTGSGKYPKIGEPYEAEQLRAPSGERLEEIKNTFITAGFPQTRTGG